MKKLPVFNFILLCILAVYAACIGKVALEKNSPTKCFTETQQKFVDSVIESKVNPTFISGVDFKSYELNVATESTIPEIILYSPDAFRLCTEVTLKKYHKINKRLYVDEWNKNYNNVYKAFMTAKPQKK